MKLLNICNRVIEYSFYLLFFLVPLAFTGDTSELFEFNKLWLTFVITIVIGFFWITKMVIKKEFRIQRTPLDIPIALFLVSEIISSFISLDPHVSLWGYYSRFNGGLFSILSYIFLYYAFVSNLKDNDQSEAKSGFSAKNIYFFIAGLAVFFIGALVSSQIKNPDAAGIPYQLIATAITAIAAFFVLMKASPKGVINRSIFSLLSSSLIVILWGLPSHFGYDPTCLLFRGTLDVSCWTSDFQPRVRIFSTLGQPDWLASYLAVLLPITIGIIINFSKEVKLSLKEGISLIKSQKFLILSSLFIFFILSYIALLYTQSRSAIFAAWVAMPILLVWYFWFHLKNSFDKKNLSSDFKLTVILFLSLGIVVFFAGQPFSQLQKFTFGGIMSRINTPAQPAKPVVKAPAATPAAPTAELGGTDSGKIRLLVWEGAISIWKNYPIFGSGLETYAFSYYKYRPAAHNLTSEWKYLYNKAHNEFLNYLATTGTVGIVTYLLMIGGFLFILAKYLYKKRGKLSGKDFLMVSIIAGYSTILLTNLLGFSVVMINILFYIIPAFVFILAGLINYDKAYAVSFRKNEVTALSVPQKLGVGAFALVSIFLIYTLVNFWNADRFYYYGSNFDRTGDYGKAYTFLKTAVSLRPSEPTFQDEFAYNNAVYGSAALVQAQKQDQKTKDQYTQLAKQLVDTAIANTNQVTSDHPNDIVFWKTKVRIFYTLSQLDPAYLPSALDAIKKAAELAPTDADVSYNLGVLYGQNGDSVNAVKTLQNTIKLKPDYSNAYYALAIFYHQLAIDSKGKVVNQDYNQKAIDELKLMGKLFGQSQQVQDAINAWSKATP